MSRPVRPCATRIDVHALDAGWRNFVYLPGVGSPDRAFTPLAQLSDVSTSDGISCKFAPTIGFYQTNGSCTYPAGEHWRVHRHGARGQRHDAARG
ncbi:hypothetical protein [Streptomyces goshikiensis]|uniref:hypothetical protein n=1 Tax=Streptomyces goshikiensis TaxID=1942 RepID=UPI0036575C58